MRVTRTEDFEEPVVRMRASQVTVTTISPVRPMTPIPVLDDLTARPASEPHARRATLYRTTLRILVLLGNRFEQTVKAPRNHSHVLKIIQKKRKERGNRPTDQATWWLTNPTLLQSFRQTTVKASPKLRWCAKGTSFCFFIPVTGSRRGEHLDPEVSERGPEDYAVWF